MRTEGNRKITIMGLLADCSTNDARKLLKKYGIPDAKNKKDLELKLAQLYKSCDDKKQLEKDFAEIHPHKDFMKKYLLPTAPVKSEVVLEDIIAPNSSKPVIIEEVPENTSNCNGKPCSCNNSNFSGADGVTTTNTNSTNTDKLVIYGMFGFVSILALVLIAKQK